MNKGPAQIVAVLRQRYRPAPRATDAGLVESTVPWTFNQILLPMILVLTAVVLTQMLDYREYRTQMLDYREYREAFTKLVKLDRDAEGPIKTRILMINYQYQKLLYHLEQIKARTRVAYFVTRFPEADRVRRSGSAPDDEDFKVYCDSIKHLDSESGYDDEAARIYAETLVRAGIRDPQGAKFERKGLAPLDNRNREVSPDDFRKDGELARKLCMEADPIVISYWNRNIIQTAILDFLDGTKQEATELQEQLVSLIMEGALDGTESMNLSGADKQIIKDMMKPEKTGQQRKQLGRELFRRLIIKLEKRLKAAGYDLIIWERLKSK